VGLHELLACSVAFWFLQSIRVLSILHETRVAAQSASQYGLFRCRSFLTSPDTVAESAARPSSLDVMLQPRAAAALTG